ncbi:Inner membrane protein YbjJ [Rubripirellula lacrimiformis]|uniref:Inner membrane protein YbjJ n=1 Tax=Rubripirellula lacrimiformis TaxID=1930273 RepID=A0A517NF34_9BACT|nr:MFS transporter [Rubripirellula lacrimiformis]QDT05743.1 Inner membrane protein YbjJ [Rubripirellula lacrimiformis]
MDQTLFQRVTVATSGDGELIGIRGLFCLNGFLIANWATRIPAVRSQFGLSEGGLGIALMLIAVGAVVSMPLAGWLCERRSSRSIALFSTIGYLVGLPLIAWMPNLATLAMALLAFGTAHGMLDVAMNVQAVAVEKRLARPINSSIHAWWSIGGLCGAVAGSLITLAGTEMRWHFAIVSTCLAVAAWPVFRRLKDSVPVDSSNAMHASDRDNPAPFAPSKPSRMDRFAARRMILVLGAIAFCVMAGEGAMADWSAVLLRQNLGVGEGVAALGFAAFAIAMAAGRLVGDGLSTRMGARNQVRLCAVVALAGVLVVITSAHAAIAMIGFALIGAGFATVVPVVFTACGTIKAISPSAALSSVSTIGYFGFLTGPPIIGFLAEWVGLRVALSSLVLTTTTILLLASKLRNRDDSESPLPIEPRANESNDLVGIQHQLACKSTDNFALADAAELLRHRTEQA